MVRKYMKQMFRLTAQQLWAFSIIYSHNNTKKRTFSLLKFALQRTTNSAISVKKTSETRGQRRVIAVKQQNRVNVHLSVTLRRFLSTKFDLLFEALITELSYFQQALVLRY
jgi:hypothetical protein